MGDVAHAHCYLARAVAGGRIRALEVVVVPARGKHTGTVIFLHGLGDTGHGWASSLAEIRSDNMRVVCPTAPTIPVTLNSGARMPAWFDLISLDPQGAEDEPGIKK